MDHQEFQNMLTLLLQEEDKVYKEHSLRNFIADYKNQIIELIENEHSKASMLETLKFYEKENLTLTSSSYSDDYKSMILHFILDFMSPLDREIKTMNFINDNISLELIEIFKSNRKITSKEIISQIEKTYTSTCLPKLMDFIENNLINKIHDFINSKFFEDLLFVIEHIFVIQPLFDHTDDLGELLTNFDGNNTKFGYEHCKNMLSDISELNRDWFLSPTEKKYKEYLEIFLLSNGTFLIQKLIIPKISSLTIIKDNIDEIEKRNKGIITIIKGELLNYYFDLDFTDEIYDVDSDDAREGFFNYEKELFRIDKIKVLYELFNVDINYQNKKFKNKTLMELLVGGNFRLNLRQIHYHFVQLLEKYHSSFCSTSGPVRPSGFPR